MLEVDITTWINTILFHFMPVITLFIAGAVCLVIYPGIMMMGAVCLLLFTLMLLKERREYI